MKIRQLRKSINQGQYLGKYRQPKIEKRIFIADFSDKIVWTCGKVTITMYKQSGVTVWEIAKKITMDWKPSRNKKQ